MTATLLVLAAAVAATIVLAGAAIVGGVAVVVFFAALTAIGIAIGLYFGFMALAFRVAPVVAGLTALAVALVAKGARTPGAS